jgi:LuxR family maltose regulon positive regulatory protein
VVSAPAGWGKTTLVAEWAHQTDLPVAWVDLEEADNDPVALL